jgi:hypothetical protein
LKNAFSEIINIWSPGYAVANNQDIALQQNPEALFSDVVEKLPNPLMIGCNF